MKELDWFVKTLECEFLVKAELKQIGYEANELYLDEMDNSLIPIEMKEGLPESLMFETMVFEDQDETEWIGAIAKDPQSKEWHLQIIIKNGEPVLRKRIEREK